MSLIKNIAFNTAELGKLIRTKRKACGITLQQTSAKSNIGVRFLSELERGKETAEIGKVISALHAVGLDLAVVQKQKISNITNSVNESVPHYNSKPTQTLSEQLGLEFPYDWSNPNINSETFIRLVLAKTRFNDILRITHYFGIERIKDETKHFDKSPQYEILNKLISHICSGIKIAADKNST
ncbi:MAG: helix-turn-helix domain-containing protein [Thiohalomonadales bacterium]